MSTSPRFDPQSREYGRRVKKAQQGLARRKLDAMVVYDRHNTFYLTGLHCSFSYLVISPREAFLLVDGRYIEAARETVRHIDVRLMRKPRQDLGRLLRGPRPRAVGFEGSAAWGTVDEWRSLLPGVEWHECGELILKQRLIKSPTEIKLIEKSARMTDQIFENVTGRIEPGMTEMDVRNRIRGEADRLGARALSFDCIVASGMTSSRPHYSPAERPLEAGELLLIDMGVVVEGYCSDMTRVVAVGRPPKPRLRRLYDAVLEAEQAALAAVKPGVACAELDRIARDKLKARRLGRYFIHGLGHGVGLEIHEAPTLNNRSQQILRAGMVITIEPGAYLPGRGGVRIEDLVVVTRNGRRVLSRTPKAFRVARFST